MLIALLLATAGDGSALPLKPLCQDERARLAAAARGPHRPHPLNEAPAAQQIYAVLRAEDGCTRPVPVRERRGEPGSRR